MQNGNQNHGGHHGNLNGGIQANPPSSLATWSTAMSGQKEKQWLKILKENKMRLIAVASIAVGLISWLFLIDYSNTHDRAERNSNRQLNAESSKGAPMQLSATPVEGGVPSSFGAPRSPYESSGNSQPSLNQQSFGTPNFSQPAAGGSYPSSFSAGPSQSFGAPTTQQSVPSITHKPGPYRMVVTR